MVQITNQNYKNIYEILLKSSADFDKKNIYNVNNDNDNDITLINSLPNDATDKTNANNNANNSDDIMKSELANYLRQQLI